MYAGVQIVLDTWPELVAFTVALVFTILVSKIISSRHTVVIIDKTERKIMSDTNPEPSPVEESEVPNPVIYDESEWGLADPDDEDDS